jgi:pyruvyltransferase
MNILRSKYKFRHLVSSRIGDFLHNKMEAYWYITERNSGDLVTPLLLKHYGFTPVHSHPKKAMLFSCGSVMELIPENFSGFVLGTGFLCDGLGKSLRNAKILAVRGELSRNKLGAPNDTVLGDPGLLVSRLLKKRQRKHYELGVVPHIVDKNDARIRNLCEKYNKEILFIDIQQDPLKVLRQIDKCNFVLSSSLHGLVFADSLQIPNIWMIVSDRVLGRQFKFHDYNSALQKTQKPIFISGDETLSQVIAESSTISVSVLEEIMNNLNRAYRLLKMETLHN